MHFIVISTLLGICVLTKAAKPRSINVALETVFEFNKPSDVDVIDQVQGILDKVKNKIKDNPKIYRTKRYKFTDFLEDAIEVLQSFNDDDLKEIIQIVDSEIRKHVKGNAFEENVRRFLSDEFDRVKIRPIKKIRKDLDELQRKVKNAKHKNNENYFLGFINTLYKRDSEQKLKRFIRGLKIFRRNNFSRNNGKFQQAVRKSLRSVLFEHLINLSENTKRRIEDYLHDAASKYERGAVYSRSYNKLKPKVILNYGVETEKFNGDKKEGNTTSGARAVDDKERDASLFQDQHKSRMVEEIRDQSDSSKQLVEKESIGRSGEISSEPNNAEEKFRRKIQFRKSKTDPSKKAQSRYYENVKMKQTQYSKELERRSSGETIRKANTKYIKSKRTQYRKLQTKNPNSEIAYLRRKFTHNKTLYSKDFENDKSKTVFEKGNIEMAKNDEILNDISLSSISNSAEINVKFKNNKIQFTINDDTVEDILVRVKDSRENTTANSTTIPDQQLDEPTNRQINSQDSTENRHETPKTRFRTVNRSRRLLGGHNNINKYLHKAPKLVEYEKDKFNANKIEYFKKNVDEGNSNIKMSPKINDLRRRDYFLAKELIADKLYARIKLDQNEFYNRPQYTGNHTIGEHKSQGKINKINLKNNDISAQNNPDKVLAKASKNYNFIDDLYIAKTKPVRFKTIDITNHEQQEDEKDNAENVADTSIRAIELTTENEPSYRRTKKPDKIDEISTKNTKSNSNVLRDFNLGNIPNVFQNFDSKSNKKLSNKSQADVVEILKKVHERKSTAQKPQTYTTNPILVEFTREIEDFYSNNFGRDRIRNVKQKQNEIKGVPKNNSEIFKTELKPNKAKRRDERRQFNLITTRKTNKISKSKLVQDTKQPNGNKIINYSVLLNTTNTTKYKSTDSYKNTEESRKLLNTSPISTTKMNKIIESKKKETKSNVFKINDSTTLLNRTPKSKSFTTITTNMNSEILNYKLQVGTKPKSKIYTTRDVKKNEIKSNKTKVIDSRRILSTPKTTTLIDLDANLDDLAFEATMADVNTNTKETDPNNFDIKKYLENIELPVVKDDPKNEIAKKIKEDLENIFTVPASSDATTAAYTDIFEALENAFDL